MIGGSHSPNELHDWIGQEVVAVEHDEHKAANRSSNACSCLIDPSTRLQQANTTTLHDWPAVDMAKEDEEKNAYEIVGVGIDATDADIKKAFRQRSLKTHPDRVRCPDLSSLVALSAHVLPRLEPPS